MDTPVAILIFNRPRTTERLIDSIRPARPRKLLVIADGPREDHPSEAELCQTTRAVLERVDWDCEIQKNFSDVNLGCGVRPATGIQWVFEQVDRAIVLEDDCLAHPTFFRYCDELLDRYQDDERIMHISGDNWNFRNRPTDFSYFFSQYCYSCGWASWRRAFRHYDPDMTLWPRLRETDWLPELLGDPAAAEFWRRKFDQFYNEGIKKTNGWDWPWLFACWNQRGLSVIPRGNLIMNVGFGEDATHTKSLADPRANVPLVEMQFPLKHPPALFPDAEADRSIAEQVGLRRPPQDAYSRLRRSVTGVLPTGLRSSLAALRRP